jgi:hypothetical protein
MSFGIFLAVMAALVLLGVHPHGVVLIGGLYLFFYLVMGFSK